MTNPEYIPHLVNLLDDDSWNIRQNVIRELASFGPNLRSELTRLSLPLNDNQRAMIDLIYRGHNRLWLKQRWHQWFNIRQEYERLEQALSLLSQYLSGVDHPYPLRKMLNYLALVYKRKYGVVDEVLLAQFLFKDKGLKGNESEYDNPQNSNLGYVIRYKRGIPISLACVYMLVGYRLGMNIEGCLFPGHFLARIHYEGETLFVDCFNGGQIIKKEDFQYFKEDLPSGLSYWLSEKAYVSSIVQRFLANLIRAFHKLGRNDELALMASLFEDADRYDRDKKTQVVLPDDSLINNGARFQPGQRIRHTRFGYRGIVVEVDEGYDYEEEEEGEYEEAQEIDFEENPSVQPWYHILVHGSDEVMCVAEIHLTVDDSQERINHPMVSYFFTELKDGTYIRNDNPWPDEED